MHLIAVIFFIAFGIFFFTIALWHEFQGAEGPVRFVSNYGSGKKPDIGDSVDVLIDESGDLGEEASASNRLLFTIAPNGAALVLVSPNCPKELGLGIPGGKPIAIWIRCPVGADGFPRTDHK